MIPVRIARRALATAAASLAFVAVARAETQAWDRTIARVAPSIVTIEIDQARAFDTEWNESSQATGFVVDADRGLILTNRHVVTPGPVVATARRARSCAVNPPTSKPGTVAARGSSYST